MMKHLSFKNIIGVLLFSVLGISFSKAGNPLIKDVGMSDPHVRIFNDKIYLFTGHDATPNDQVWVMRDWKVYSSTDLINWNLETTITPKENYMPDNSTNCWAGDAAERNGKYYWFFSNRNYDLGVMSSNSPNGPYSDALGQKLVDHHDPTILIDDDANKTPYIVYGSKEIGGYKIARLNNDMISLAETPKTITINGTAWQNAPNWMDKNYVFKHNGKYYLSWGRDYAVSNNVYGPYQSVGAVATGYKLNEFAHGSFFWWKGQFYHIWCYYIRDGYKYRESIMTYCHFDDEGNIVTDTRFLDQHFANGVGQYDASWSSIEAEWFYEKHSGVNKSYLGSENFALSSINNNEWVRFANTSFNGQNEFTASVSFTGTNGSIEVRSGGVSGTLLGTLSVPNGNNQTLTTNITSASGNHNLYLVFKASSGSFELDGFNFGAGAVSGYQDVPGTIEAESFSAQSGIQTEPTSDVGGGLNVGYTAVGDWFEYQVDVATTGDYEVEFRVAAKENNIMFDLKKGSAVLASVNSPYTGGWQDWKTITKTVSLTAGKQTLRVLATGDRWNINWLRFTKTTDSGTDPVVSFTNPVTGQSFNAPASVYVNVNASDPDGSISNVKLYLDGAFVRQESYAPYEWNASGQNDPLLANMSEGTYTLRALATDNSGSTGEASINITVGDGGSTSPASAIIHSYSNQESTQPASNILDGDNSDPSRWSANGFPQWVVLDYGETVAISGTKLWSYQDRAYQFRIEASNSATTGYSTIVDRTSNTSSAQPISNTFAEANARYIRLTVTGASGYTGTWSAITELEVTALKSAESPLANSIGQVGAYPNPVSDVLNIVLPDGHNYSSLQIVDMTGRTVFSEPISDSQSNVIETNALNSVVNGLYLLRVSGNVNHETVLIQKQ